MTNYEILRKPIQPNEIEWRVQSAKGGKTTIVPYIQSRAVMNRFDASYHNKCLICNMLNITSKKMIQPDCLL